MGRRAAQHVEANASEGTVVPRRQPAPVTPLLAVPVAAVEGAHGGYPHAGVWNGAGASRVVMGVASSALEWRVRDRSGADPRILHKELRRSPYPLDTALRPRRGTRRKPHRS